MYKKILFNTCLTEYCDHIFNFALNIAMENDAKLWIYYGIGRLSGDEEKTEQAIKESESKRKEVNKMGVSPVELTAIAIVPLFIILLLIGLFTVIVVCLLRLIKWLKVSLEEAAKVRLELGKIAEEISLIRKAKTTEEPV